MANFKDAYEKTGGNEGGYVNDPDDKGGETWKGIARKKHPNWEGWAIINSYKGNPDFLKLLEENGNLAVAHQKFFKQIFWDRIRGDEINNQMIAESIYDSAVNMGVAKAIKLAQRSIPVTETGVMDDTTIKKLNHTV